MYTTLRSNGLFTLENMLSYFERVWEVIPPKMYNESQQIKYINDGAVGMVALHGNRKLQIKKWLRERIAYLDSKFGYYAGGGTNEQYVNFRMNYQGAVSLDLSTYYTVYAKVRWASKNEQVIRIAKGQKKTFSYYSDVGTDREVMIMLPESLKTIENISNIHPNSIDISKATKLTQIEAHNPNLFSVDLSKNKYLRKVDFNGCTNLGTETATMTLNYCKYLNKVDLRGTKITAVTFNTKGGSLREIYYPTTIQSINLINQGLLTDMILPYGEDGSKAPVDLATINIENCPNVQNMIDLASNPTSLDGMKYCRNMTINNSIKLSTINFNGFTRLANVNLQNIETLEAVDFLNLTKKGETSSLRYIGVSACPKLTTISMNVNDPNYEITWANEGILDLQTSGAVRTIESNCVIKGLTTIILPQTIESLYFTTEYGSGYADVINIWSAEASSVSKTGVFPVAYHLNSENVTDEYVGIDFRGLSLKNIDLGGLVNIPDAINFSLYPTNVNPNFNLHRNGDTLPYLQPKGILDLSNYTGSLAKFFNGVDLDVLQVTSKNTLPQTDYSYCFFNSIFTSMDSINPLLEKIDEVFNASHMFDSTIINDTSLLETLVWKRGAIIDYMFANTKIENLDGLSLPSFIGSAIGTFSRCKLLTTAKNMIIAINGSIAHFLEDCPKLTSIEGSMIRNISSIAYLLANDRRVNVGDIFMSWELNKCSDMSYAFSGTSINNSTFDLNTIILGTSNCKYDYIFNGAMDLCIKLTGATVNVNNIEGFTKGVINSVLDISGMDLSARSNFTSAFENQEINEIILTDVVWGNDLIFDKTFKATRIEEDFLLPLTTVSCAECFSNIPTLISIHSNWKQAYKKTIVPNNCYSGNSNLLNLDGVLVKNEYTDVLDEAPEVWGGTGFSKEYTGIYEVIIPSDNYNMNLSGGLASDNSTKRPPNKLLMGDGGVMNNFGANSVYTYAKAGTYIVKGHLAVGKNGTGQVGWVLSKVIQYPSAIDKFDLNGARSLTYVNCANVTRPLTRFSCSGCTSLTTLDNSENLDFSNCTDLSGVFQNCYFLKFNYLNGKPNWKFKTDNNIGFRNAFLNCGSKLDLSIDEEYALDLSECGQVKCTNYINVFNNSAFTKLIVNVDTYRDVDSADHRSSFSSPKLKELSFAEGSIWGSDMRGTFNIPNATTVDLSNLDISHTVYGADKAFNYLPNVVDFKFGKGWQHSTSFADDKKLSRESLLSIINNLEVVSGETLTLGSVNLAKLTDDDIAIATNKGWSVV